MKFVLLLIASAAAINISSPDPYKNVTAKNGMGANDWISEEVIEAHKNITEGLAKEREDIRVKIITDQGAADAWAK